MSEFEKLQLLCDDIGKWSDETFGYNSDPSPKIHHLKKEVGELLDTPFDITEYADCFLLLLNALRVANFNIEMLYNSSKIKLELNKLRKWGKPDKNGVFEHLKNKESSNKEKKQ